MPKFWHLILIEIQKYVYISVPWEHFLTHSMTVTKPRDNENTKNTSRALFLIKCLWLLNLNKFGALLKVLGIIPLCMFLANWSFEGPNLANFWSFIWVFEKLIESSTRIQILGQKVHKTKEWRHVFYFFVTLRLWTP